MGSIVNDLQDAFNAIDDLFSALNKDPQAYMVADGLHMNAAGNTRIASVFSKKVK